MTQLYEAVVLITDASGGFGQELTRQLLEAGSQLILTDTDEAILRERVEAIQTRVKTGNVLAILSVDLSTREGCETLYDQVRTLNINIDILINNAGIAFYGRTDEVPNEKWERLMQVNLLAPMRLSALFATDMITRQKGHIVNISSVAGWSGTAGLAHYAASKFGLRGFSEGLFNELKDYNVKVTVVYPFFSRTPIVQSERYGILAKNNLDFPQHLATDPAKVMSETIQGIVHKKLHVFPDAMAKRIHLLKRYSSNYLTELVMYLQGDSKVVDTTNKHLIIGAGFVGLGMAQALKAANIAYDQVDASDDIGGNWYHGVYETAHIISSRKVTQFTHFPMPDNYPDFPSAQNMRDYLNAFANHFNLRESIELNRTISYVRPVENNLWEVTFSDGQQKIYKGVLICNGHHWCKRFPEFKGEFNGEIIHSKDYKHPDQLRGKRVLVIGGGNSACDLAAEAARVGSKCVLSMRESVWFIPKSFAGFPVVDLIKWWMPQWFQRLITYGIIRLTFGTHDNYGLAKPNYRVFDKHPTLNNEVPYYIKHGRIKPKPAVHRLDGCFVEFIDGSREAFDLIVCATGYNIVYPFLPPELQRVELAVVKCYGGSFLEDYKGLYYIGWGQARGGVGSLISAISPFFIRCLKLQDEINVPLGLVFKEMGEQLPKTHLSDPQQIFRQLKLTNFFFNQIVKRAYQVNTQYSNFSNSPLPRSSKALSTPFLP